MTALFVGGGSFTSFGNPGGGSGLVNYSPTVGNTLIVYGYGQTTAPVLSDGSNTYTNLGQQAASGNSVFGNMWVAPVTTGGALAIALSGTTNGLYVQEWSGLAASAYIAGSFQSGGQAGPGTTPNAVTTSAPPNVTTQPALLCGLTVDTQTMTSSGTNPAPILGTTFAYNSRTVGWLGTSGQQGALAEDIRRTSTGTAAITFTSSSGAQFDTFITLAAAFAEFVASIGDGTSSASTTVATGTGGNAMPAITAGQLLDVLICAQTTSALTDTTPTDNTSGKITWAHSRTFDDHANGYIFERWYGVVTANFAAPVITSTWAGGTPTKLSIAVGIQNGVTTGAPWSPNSWSQVSQTGLTGANTQSSGALAGPTTAPSILTGWGFNTAVNGAPTAGTSPLAFTQIATAWAGLGSACLTYESTQVVAGSDPAVTFTPFSTSKAYTFAQAYNLPAVVSGPLPRCLYVMP